MNYKQIWLSEETINMIYELMNNKDDVESIVNALVTKEINNRAKESIYGKYIIL